MLAQAANRVNFNQPEEEFLDGDDVVGLGVLGKEGSGRLRAQVEDCLSPANLVSVLLHSSVQSFCSAAALKDRYGGIGSMAWAVRRGSHSVSVVV